VRRLFSPTFLVHLVIVVFLLAIVVAVNLFSKSIGDSRSRKWLCQIDREMYTDCKTALGEPTPTPTDTPRGTGVANVNSTAEIAAKGPSPSPTPEASPSPTPGASPSPSPTASPSPSPPPASQEECGKGKYALTPAQDVSRTTQLDEIKRLAKFHGDVMAYFFSAYYVSISVMMFGGVIVAVALFFIAQNGWGPTNSYVKTVFVVMAAVTAYYSLFPSVFQQNKNITDNMALFLEYQTLRREVESYPQTCANVANERKDPATFITYVNSEMRRLGKIAIGFDYTKIDYKGAFDLSREQTKPPGSVGDQGGNNQNPKNSNGK
jgi:hypothetical protein